MRDFPGVPFSTIKDPNIRDIVGTIDRWARDLSRGMGRIQNGETPDGSGTGIPISELADGNDASKRATVDMSAIGTATTVNLKVPGGTSGDVTLALLEVDQTFLGINVWGAGASNFKMLITPGGTGNIFYISDTGDLIRLALKDDSSFNINELRLWLNSVDVGNYVKQTVGSLGANRTVTWPDLTGRPVVVGDDAPAVAAGALGKVDLTAQVATIGATNLTNGAAAGLYRVSYAIETTTGDGAAGTIQFQINYTDTIGATIQTGATLALTGTGRDLGSFVTQLASGEISYQTNLGGIFGTSQYAVYARVEALG